ncbi:MAG: transposase [Ignavibacteriae bacterium]|nr:transposase [Ignavibacteriota bacterium]
MLRKVIFAQDEYYHIYNRGCNRENIFLSDENYRFLLRNLKSLVEEYNVCVIAYCLMPNHYHFLLRQDGEKNSGKLIQFLFNKYTKAFNAMHKRTGTLFEGPFKAIHVDKQEYLIHLCRYIHRNPLEAGLVANIEDWEYTNYLEWIGKRKGMLWDKEFVNDNFRTAEEYKKFVLEYISPKKLEEEWRKYRIER